MKKIKWNIVIFTVIFTVLFTNVFGQNWEKTYTEFKDLVSLGRIFCETEDGFICAGMGKARGHQYIFKVNKTNGNLIWYKHYTEIPSQTNISNILEMPNKNLLITGSAGNKLMIAILKKNGEILKKKIWNSGKYIGGGFSDLVQCSDTSYSAIGWTHYQGNGYSFLMNFNDSLKIQQKNFYSVTKVLAVHLIKDQENYVFVGPGGSGILHSIATKTDKQGNILWQKEYSSIPTYPWDAILCTDNAYLICGRWRHNGNMGPDYPSLIKINREGDLIWYNGEYLSNELEYGGVMLNCWETDDEFVGLVQADEYKNGSEFSKKVRSYIIKVRKSDGKLVYQREYLKQRATNGLLTQDGSIVIAGGDWEYPLYTDNGPWLIKTDLDSNEFQPPEPEPPEKILLSHNYPNPFNISTTIRYEIPENMIVNINIYNIKGEKVKNLAQDEKEAGIYFAHWSGQNHQGQVIGSGIYFYQMIAGKKIISRKMIFLK